MKRFFSITAALFKKDMKDTLRNANVMILLVLPLFFCLLYKYILAFDMGTDMVLFMTTAMCLAMVPTSFLAMLVAEEKEKNTLRTLMLSGVSSVEFIASKMLVTWILMEVVNIINFLLLGLAPGLLPVYLLATTLGSISLLLFGATIGILCRDQMSTGVLATPVMLVFLIPSIMAQFNAVFAVIADFTPIDHVMHLFFSIEQGQSFFSVGNLKSLGVLLCWIAIAALCYSLAYRKKRLDG